jgi:hypothetical protein
MPKELIALEVPMISEVVLMVSLGVFAITARVLVPSAEALSSTAEGAIAGTAIVESSDFFFDFLMLSSSLSLKS